jgi:N-acyl-D-aspartate/D-glutamate deacylase
MAPIAAPQDFDLLIRGGRIVDGTGNPSFLGDIGVNANRIVAIGHLAGAKAKRTVDAQALTVAPGFIDIHNHSDYTLGADGDAQSMIRQGVTSMILGEGGRRLIGGKQQPSAKRVLLNDAPADWTTSTVTMRACCAGHLDQYRQLCRVQPDLDLCAWRAGGTAHRGRTRPNARAGSRIDATRRLGVSSSLSGPPGSWIDTDTLVAMCEAAAPYGGSYSTHMRTEGRGVFESVAEAIEIGRRAHVPVDIIHLKIAEHTMWGQMPELAASIARARAQGQEVQANVYPYRAGQNDLSSIIPPWAHEGGTEALIQRLKEPALRPRLTNEILHGIPGSNWYDHYTATGGWDGMLLVSLTNPAYKKFEGMRMNQVIEALGKPPLDVLFELLEANGGSVPTVYFHHSEDDMRYALRQPFVSIGSDGTAVTTEGPLAAGHPHPRYYGTFPRVLGRYVREEKVLTLEEAIRKMTSANAAKVGIFDRGILRPGMMADLAIFDAARVIDNATFEKPHQYATGVEFVVVNGTLVLDRGRHTGARPGTILKRQHAGRS